MADFIASLGINCGTGAAGLIAHTLVAKMAMTFLFRVKLTNANVRCSSVCASQYKYSMR